MNVFSPQAILQPSGDLFSAISSFYALDEAPWIEELLTFLNVSTDEEQAIAARATALITAVRDRDSGLHMVDAWLLQYSLDTEEGVLLMCLAEALMRVPDHATADALIRDKLSVADWQRYLKKSDSFLVNASTWGLMLTGKVLNIDCDKNGSAVGVVDRFVRKMSEPVIRAAVSQAMTIMAQHFVLGDTMALALKRASKPMEQGYCYSFDRLGEAALTQEDAQQYYQHYLEVLAALNQQSSHHKRSSLSIKLSALHPRYESAQEARVLEELFTRVVQLIQVARQANIAVTIDAEEADRLELSLKLFKKLYHCEACRGWGQLGMVVQAYAKRALPTLCFLAALAKEQGDVIPVRLVKGAYWDSEIKWAQQLGLAGYPVFTRKESTDISYLACVKWLLSEPVRGLIFPQFATHNAHTVAAVLEMAGDYREFEFQRLHGMGESLYDHVMTNEKLDVRIYAPVGEHKDLLPYLVRRLLENGANSSFVHRLVDVKTPVANLVQHPAAVLHQHEQWANPAIVLPRDLLVERINSQGFNIAIESHWEPLNRQLRHYDDTQWQQGSIIDGKACRTGEPVIVQSPYNHSSVVGRVYWATKNQIEQALSSADGAFSDWSQTTVEERAACLERIGDLLEDHSDELMALCQREAGRTLQDAIDEVREAVDFCRYYAAQARQLFTKCDLPGVAGESNEWSVIGRGVFVCISPWNFPLAIFMGQVAAALVTGNTVVAKPAEATSLIAARATELMLEAGVPRSVMQLVLGEGADIGAQLTSDARVAGVVFTGSTATAMRINRSLAARGRDDGSDDGNDDHTTLATLVAETGGQNAMIVDSTALPEQVVTDALASAFGSAGQRCSSLRVLYLQEDIADDIIRVLKGAMEQLVVGDPRLRATDIGPVITQQAQRDLQRYIDELMQTAIGIAQVALPDSCQHGTFIAPSAFEISSITQLKKEHFGPILHVIRYPAQELNRVIDDINSTGFGLTLGIHSRNESLAQSIADGVNVGNVYINRNQVGAVVGMQPFGGRGLSGTGPKAGGPHYLQRFVTEKTCTVNTAAIGGNASLLSLGKNTSDSDVESTSRT